MRTANFRIEISLPGLDDFLGMYPHYAAAQQAERFLFDAITTPVNFVRAAAITDVLNLPAISAVADLATSACSAQGGLNNYRKQMAGAIVCCLMLANGYARTGVKHAISRPGWTRGELYSRGA